MKKVTRIKEVAKAKIKGYAVMRTTIKKGRDKFTYFDLKYGGVVITGCRLVEGKKGDFLGMPSKYNEKDDEYYPLVFMSREVHDAFMKIIETADDNDKWEEVDEDDYLSANDDEDEKKSKRGRKKDDDDDDDDDDEDEKPAKKSKRGRKKDDDDDDDDDDEDEKPAKKSKKTDADDDYPF